jgi:hypothetical protein
MEIFMHDTQKRPEDRLEETNAANTLIDHLKGKPILQTSGDIEHQLTPSRIKIMVKPTEQGEELSFHITQLDRHHPHLVYDTIKSELAKLPELSQHKAKELQPEHDYHADTGKILIRYELPSGAADTVIHSLSQRSQGQAAQLEASPQRWADQVENPALKSAIGKAEDWVSQLKEFFPSAKGRA